MRELVLIHGRDQQHKDSRALKKAWIDAWTQGLAESGLRIPIPETAVRFPYYGQTLFDLADGVSAAAAAAIIVRGTAGDDAEAQFVREVLQEAAAAKGITDAEIDEELTQGDPVIERGAQNWRMTRVLAKLLDRRVPGASGSIVALITSDVHKYLRNPGVGNRINDGVRGAFSPNVETVVVGHSLGSVVGYSVLTHEGRSHGWNVPLFVTLGSPLAVKAIRKALAPIQHPHVATHWLNARDPADIVALYPLTQTHFDVTPRVENNDDIHNETSNRHGIRGYLSDATVARRIYEALTR